MAAIVLLLAALVTPPLSSALPQDVAAAPPQAVRPGLDAEVVRLEPEGKEEDPGYQYQLLNPADGSYRFGYEKPNGEFRVEQRLGSGQLRGISGTRAADGTVVDAFRYSYDGYGYKQEPYTSDQVPSYLRSAAGPEGLPQLISQLQLFPEYFP